MSAPKRLERLPVFPAPPASAGTGAWRVHVGGLTSRPVSFGYDEIRLMPGIELTADFRCEEGWEVQRLRWTGVPLAHLVALAQPLAEARYVAVGSGEFVASVPLSEVGPAQPLLAYLLDGAPLPREHGGPLRLVLEQGSCYQSVKWVERLELTAGDGTETASGIALARINREENQ